MVFKNICVLVLWMKVASALEGLLYGAKLLSEYKQVRMMIMEQFNDSIPFSVCCVGG